MKKVYLRKLFVVMMQQLIGRKKELKALRSYIDSDKSEFVAVYGRRRVGKTFLIRNVVNDNFSFFVTGVHNAKKNEQLINFSIALNKVMKEDCPKIFKNWIIAFYELSQYLETLPEGRKVIFIDELPWLDTAKSGFIPALENFWNSWAVLRNDIKLIVCGSATSWMINNLIHSRGGLHNRLTHHILVEPFTLAECEDYFKTYGFAFSRKQIAECYMVMGGIPYYLSKLDKSKSLAQNIDQLFFASNAELKYEFRDLYHALYKKADAHIDVVTALATKGKGLTRQEILKITKLTNNGAFSTVLDELEYCGFIRFYEPFGNYGLAEDKRQKRDTLYQLIDFYTLFYFQFIKNNKYQDEHFWTTSMNSPTYHAWSGVAFEMLCLNHLPQVKNALGISGVQTLACSWKSTKVKSGAQIDLLIDRKDATINVCEIKFSKDEFEINKDYEQKLNNKIDALIEESGTKKSVILTMLTTFGIKQNKYSDKVQCQVVLDDLFA